MKSLLVVCLLGLLALSAYAEVTEEVAQAKWAAFLVKYDKTYADDLETAYRYSVFKQNLVRAEELNKNEDEEVFGVTKFSDLTPEEFKATYLMKNAERWFPSDMTRAPESAPLEPQDIPTTYDWTNEGAVTPVYNQGQCGSCWAFSATETIESMWFMAGNTLTKLSMQQIVSCDHYDDGCGGGEPMTAYYYTHSVGGLDAYADYPYTSGGGANGQCRFNKADIAGSINAWEYVTKNRNETQMQAFSYSKGPLSVCVDASSWSSYTGGILSNGCGNELDHCVQLTGWSTSTAGKDYWIVRNSWGTDWGLDGYIYLERDHNVCGIAQEVTVPIVEKSSEAPAPEVITF